MSALFTVERVQRELRIAAERGDSRFHHARQTLRGLVLGEIREKTHFLDVYAYAFEKALCASQDLVMLASAGRAIDTANYDEYRQLPLELEGSE